MSHMYFHIDPQNEVPIYEQVVRQITYAVANQSLRPGELIPSVRNLARQLAINPNTVARAYRHLQDQNVLTSHRGSGMAVTNEAVEFCQAKRLEILRLQIRSLVQETRYSEIPKELVEQLFREELAKSLHNDHSNSNPHPIHPPGVANHE